MERVFLTFPDWTREAESELYLCLGLGLNHKLEWRIGASHPPSPVPLGT